MWNDPFLSPSPDAGQRLSKTAPCSPVKPLLMDTPTRTDAFHVLYKVPMGDTPYVKAKQVQLVDKNPERAIALFWAAVNAGDRVDSALKDMAIVMKQQNRAEEAIEAIKSLRSRCSDQAQESLDNVLLDLYKRCGRLDDQIALLKHKLELINQGLAFNGKRTKTARSQGKKFQVSIEQEATRLLGNLGWAYMQKNNYVAAEAVYRKALSIAPDNNKTCNLGVCLMKQGRLDEAKAMLESIKSICGDGCWEVESNLKSYERGQEILKDLEALLNCSSNDETIKSSPNQEINKKSPESSMDAQQRKCLSSLQSQSCLRPSVTYQPELMAAHELMSSDLAGRRFEAAEDEQSALVAMDDNLQFSVFGNYNNWDGFDMQQVVAWENSSSNNQRQMHYMQGHTEELTQKLEMISSKRDAVKLEQEMCLSVPLLAAPHPEIAFNNATPPPVGPRDWKAVGLKNEEERLPLTFDRTNEHNAFNNGSKLINMTDDEVLSSSSRLALRRCLSFEMCNNPTPEYASSWDNSISIRPSSLPYKVVGRSSNNKVLPPVKENPGLLSSNPEDNYRLLKENSKPWSSLCSSRTQDKADLHLVGSLIAEVETSPALDNETSLSARDKFQRRLRVFEEITLPTSPLA